MILDALSTAVAVARKELVSAVRDRQTLVYTIVLPLALYPAIFWVMLQGYAYLEGRDRQTQTHAAVFVEHAAGFDADDVVAALEDGDDRRNKGPFSAWGEDGGVDEATIRELLAEVEDEEDGAAPLDCVVAVRSEPPGTRVWYDSTSSRSNLAAERVEERLRKLAEDLRRRAFEDPRALLAFEVQRHDIASEHGLGGFILSFILPMVFVFMSVMGCFYPAVDVTAGEIERGTAETTMLLPRPRLGIHLGKILAVATAGLVATSLNFAGMALAAEYLLASFPERPLEIRIPWGAFLPMLPFALSFVFFVSAFLVGVASLTKTFKQGQSLLGAVQLVVILPAMIGIIPGVELTPALACVPVMQTVLALRELLQPGALESLPALLIVALTQLVYAGLAIAFALRLTGRESSGDGSVSPRRFLSLLRARATPR